MIKEFLIENGPPIIMAVLILSLIAFIVSIATYNINYNRKLEDNLQKKINATCEPDVGINSHNIYHNEYAVCSTKEGFVLKRMKE